MIIFQTGFLTALILDAKALFTSFIPLVLFLISVLLAFHVINLIMGLMIGRRRRLPRL